MNRLLGKLSHKKIELINIYVPNGNPINTEKYVYKKDWFNLFIKRIKEIISNINLTLPEDLTEAEIINTGLSNCDRIIKTEPLRKRMASKAIKMHIASKA